MKKHRYFLIMVALVLSLNDVYAQSDEKPTCPCCTEAYQGFDFWVGDWVVFNDQGKIVGNNSITKDKTYSNCVVREVWTAKGLSRGTSYNYYDRTAKTWNQVWIDNSGFSLTLKGNRVGNSMIMKSEILTGEKGNYYNQITWQLNEDESVTQTWDLFSEDGKLLQQAFKGIYKKTVK